jgi:Flp pilus assembly protein TadD
MSMTLKLVDRLLALARNYQQVGRELEALHVLYRLSRIRELPAAVAEETQARLGEIQLRRGRYRRARRHLTAALLYQPHNARYHFLMAKALDADEKRGDPTRAAEHYRKSLEIDPHQPQCLRDYGRLALRLGDAAAGLKALRRAVELEPHDPEVVADLVDGLQQAGRQEEVPGVLQAAQFRNRHDRRFRQLWQDYQFDRLREAQAAQRADQVEAEEDEPVLLPFVRPAEVPALMSGPKLLRQDAAARPAAPHTSRFPRLPGQKHAQ